MYQKDFILRMVEMLSELIAGILGFIKKGDFDKANQMIERSYHDMLKQDADFFGSIPIEELTNKLIQENQFTPGHFEILAELFYAQGKLAQAQGMPDESLLYYRKSQKLFEFVIASSETFSFDMETKMSLLQNRIAELGLHRS